MPAGTAVAFLVLLRPPTAKAKTIGLLRAPGP